MKIKVSWIYLVLYVLGVLAAGVLTGVYGNEIGLWIAYSFLGAYGIMILINATLIEKISEVKVEAVTDKEELPDSSELPDSLGSKKVGETTLQLEVVPPEPPP